MVDIPTLLKRNRQKTQQCLAAFLPSGHTHPDLNAFYSMLWDYPSRTGKGLRSALCLITCQAFGGDPDDAIQTATALELFQNWILIHDDIEDASDLRRGEPCLHKKHGVPMAINVGDALHSQMWRLLHLNASVLGYERSFEVLDEFGELVDTVAAGQHIELTWVAEGRWELSEQDYYGMCERKTSSYTCISPCRLGALIAGASADAVDAFQEIGRILGLAFQLQDDVLNLVGETERYGKEIAGDLWEGKRTLILIHLQHQCTDQERQRIRAILGKPRQAKTEADVQWILEQMHAHGSIEYAKEEALRLAHVSKQHFLKKFPTLPNEEGHEAFLALVDYLTRRDH